MSRDIRIGIIAVLAGVVLIFGYSRWKQWHDLKVVNGLIDANPAYAMIVKDHPEARAGLVADFLAAYRKDGAQGLAAAAPGVQQGINSRYLLDYIWYFGDAPLRDFVSREYEFLDVLNRSAETKKTCTDYIMDSTAYVAAQQAAGGSYFADYMKASEKLFASAAPHRRYDFSPGSADYERRAGKAMAWFAIDATIAAVGNTDIRTALKDRSRRNCAIMTVFDKALLKLKDDDLSIAWRTMTDETRQFRQKQQPEGTPQP